MNSRAAGFSLIELVVTLVIVGILLGVALPSYSAYLQNAKIRTAASSVQTGLQLARTQAILLNLPVDFTRTSATGAGWSVGLQSAAVCPIAVLPNCPLIESKSNQEGGIQEVEVGGSTLTVSFNGFGQNTTGATTITFENSIGGVCAPGGPMRCLNVVIAPGGQARICDPAVVDVNDSRHC